MELDLEAAGIIENSEAGNNIYDLRKNEGYQWWYSREFDTPKTKTGEHVEIVFEGLDCFGTMNVELRPFTHILNREFKITVTI